MKNPKAKAAPPLQGGSRLSLHRGENLGRRPVHVTIDRFENGRIWVKGSSGSLAEGDSILLEYQIEDDGRYLARGEIEALNPDSTFISCREGWRRIQDRSFVRIATHGLEVKVPRRNPDGTAGAKASTSDPAPFEMLDVSAGGIRFESQEPFDLGEQLVCQFELPRKACYVLPAQVVRSQLKPGSKVWYQVAVEFVDLDERHRSELLQWIYQEQARRHRNAKAQAGLKKRS